MMVLYLNIAHKSLSTPLGDDQVQPNLFQGMRDNTGSGPSGKSGAGRVQEY